MIVIIALFFIGLAILIIWTIKETWKDKPRGFPWEKE